VRQEERTLQAKGWEAPCVFVTGLSTSSGRNGNPADLQRAVHAHAAWISSTATRIGLSRIHPLASDELLQPIRRCARSIVLLRGSGGLWPERRTPIDPMQTVRME
jgi:hypothetical protein